VSAHAARPRIAVFSGPTATIMNSAPLVTSNQARDRHGLPPLVATEGALEAYQLVFDRH
jgi:hypothetical protein